MINLNTNSEDYNRVCSLDNYYPDNMDRNLDHFYTLLNNTDILNYDFQSLNISGSFSIKDYVESSNVDYFKKLLRSSIILNGKKINYNKYSKFVYSDGSISNSTLFRGIKFNIHKVDNIKVLNGNVEQISYNSTNNFNDYNFSILMSENEHIISRSKIDGTIGITSSSINSFQWTTIDEIGSKKIINNSDYILSNSIIYEYVGSDSLNLDDFNVVKLSPDNGFIISEIETIFWKPSSLNDYVYYNGEYYIRNNDILFTIDFWNPHKLDYILDDIVYYKDIIISPDISQLWEIYMDSYDNFKWEKVNIWNPSTIYDVSDYVYYQGSLYKSIISNNDNIIGDLESWEILYNMLYDTNVIYNSGLDNNNVFIFNNTYYLCVSNINNKTLENGITIYINNIHKNILLNIYVNDNTYNNDVYNERFKLYDNRL